MLKKRKSQIEEIIDDVENNKSIEINPYGEIFRSKEVLKFGQNQKNIETYKLQYKHKQKAFSPYTTINNKEDKKSMIKDYLKNNDT